MQGQVIARRLQPTALQFVPVRSASHVRAMLRRVASSGTSAKKTLCVTDSVVRAGPEKIAVHASV
jgi:hypothetical protein